LHGHGPADNSRHHAGSWKDIIPAPAEGCPSTVSQPESQHANSNPNADANANSNGHAGKITICHATRSATNPYVEITISENGLHGHGPADDSRHHAGSWKDIIPAPAEGCPGAQNAGTTAAPVVVPQTPEVGV